MRVFHGILLAAALWLVVSCQMRPRTEAGADEQVVLTHEEIVAHPYDVTWSALNDLINARTWRANSINESTGKFSIAPFPVANDSGFFACGSGRRDSYSDHHAQVDITVKRVSASGTNVGFVTRIDASDTSGRYSGRVECRSNGLLEKEIIAAMDSVIASRKMK